MKHDGIETQPVHQVTHAEKKNNNITPQAFQSISIVSKRFSISITNNNFSHLINKGNLKKNKMIQTFEYEKLGRKILTTIIIKSNLPICRTHLFLNT
jgi:hypothetical protein